MTRPFGLPIPADYEVLATLGQGGMGSIFKAVHRHLRHVVALKMHAPPLDENPAHRDRLRQRIGAASRLRHPHLVRVFDFGELEGWLWEAQELMEGGDLTRLLQDGPLAPRLAVKLLVPIAVAVQYLHEHGYIHRNLKPREVLLTADGVPKLGGLGMSMRVGEESESEGAIVGTPAYMAPEQWRGDPTAIGPATDIYGLGGIFYEMLAGRSPFQGAGIAERARQALEAAPPPPSQFQPRIPRSLEAACLRCLEKDPRRRFPSAAALVETLRAVMDVSAAGSMDTPVFSAPAPARGIPRARGPTYPSPSATADTGEHMASPAAPPMPAGRRTGPGLWGRLWTRLRAFLRAGPIRDPVDATVFAPPAVAPRQEFLVQIFAHLPAQADQARALAREFDAQAERRGVTSLELEIARGERLTFHLTLPGLNVEPARADLVWRGRPEAVQFAVRVPSGHAPGTVVGTATASLNSVPVGHVKFKLTVTAAASSPRPAVAVATGESAQVYKHAFISYASADRKEVLKRVQMLARLRIRFFQDVLDLDPGTRYEKEIFRFIDQSDLFLLFWSSAARQSHWVLQEVRYALRRKGDDDLAPPEILPVVLEGPPPPPPDELAHLHFNDYLLYLMQESDRS